VLGTIVGSVFVVALVSKIDSLLMIYVIGLVFLLIALFARLSGQAWVYYVFMVPATACLNATALTQVGELGKQRVIDNAVGGALVILVTAVTIGYSHVSSKSNKTNDQDHELQGVLQPSV